jgi:hypothetical protein
MTSERTRCRVSWQGRRCHSVSCLTVRRLESGATMTVSSPLVITSRTPSWARVESRVVLDFATGGSQGHGDDGTGRFGQWPRTRVGLTYIAKALGGYVRVAARRSQARTGCALVKPNRTSRSDCRPVKA